VETVRRLGLIVLVLVAIPVLIGAAVVDELLRQLYGPTH
jgi:hypothetical protein